MADPSITIKYETFFHTGVVETTEVEVVTQDEYQEQITSQSPQEDGSPAPQKPQEIVILVPKAAPKRKSLPPRNLPRPCLFCQRNAPRELMTFEDRILGATCSVLLQKHLQVFFVVRNLLDVPATWCESVLGTGQFPDPQYWLRICERCLPSIEDAWRLNQKLLVIQTQINEIKEKLKNKIVTSQAKVQTHNNKKGGGKTDLMKEIRQVVCSNGELAFDQNTIIADEDNTFHHHISDSSDVDWELTADDKKSSKRTKSTAKPSSSKSRRKRSYQRKFPLRCEICPAKFRLDQERQFNDHKEVHERCKSPNDHFVCTKCKFPFDNDRDLELHLSRRHPKSGQRKEEKICKLCSYTTCRRFKLEQHIQTEHPGVSKEEAGLEDLRCPVCNRLSATIQSLGLHKRIMHPELFGEEASPDSLYQCDECGEKFASGIRLLHHKNLHARKNNPVPLKYTCEECGKAFKFASRLKEHQAVHQTKGAWMCSTCGMDFKFKHGLAKHRQAHHPDELDPESINPRFVRKRVEDFVECKVCNVMLPAALRRRHMKTHLDPSKSFQCDQCDRSYFKLQGLKKHKEINHSDGSAKVNCPFCHKIFIHQEYLKWHYRYCAVKRTAETKLDKDVKLGNNDASESDPLTMILS